MNPVSLETALRGEWKDQRSDRSRQDSRELFNDKPIFRDLDNENSEWQMIENEQSFKQCHYYKNTGHEIEECRKCQCTIIHGVILRETRETSRD